MTAYVVPLMVLAGYAIAAWRPSAVQPGFFTGPSCVLVIFVAHKLTDATFKALGWSQTMRLVEVRRLSAMPSQQSSDACAVVILPYRAQSNAMAGVFIAMAIWFVLMELRMPSHSQRNREALILLCGLFFIMATLSYVLRHTSMIRIDDHGITVRGGFMPRSVTVPWSKVASCELTVARDTCGTESIRPVFKNAAGEDLFSGETASLAVARLSDQRRAFGYLKRRFPKFDADLSEL